MCTANAALEAVTLARVIANARDVVVPDDFKVGFNEITFNGYGLGDIYDVLAGPCRYLIKGSLAADLS
jgi:hypothetical protein